MRTSSFVRSLALLAGTVSMLSACAASGGASAGASASGSTAPRGDRNMITQEEMQAVGATNLYDVIQRIRPQWLRGANLSNTQADGTTVVVYQGTTQLGGLEALRQVAPGYPLRVRWLDAATASNTLPGLGSRRVAGAIIIELPGGTR